MEQDMYKRCVYIFAFNSKQENVSGIPHFLVQLGSEIAQRNLNAAYIYLFGIKCKYILYMSFVLDNFMLLKLHEQKITMHMGWVQIGLRDKCYL